VRVRTEREGEEARRIGYQRYDIHIDIFDTKKDALAFAKDAAEQIAA
jgi:hypothetical protein